MKDIRLPRILVNGEHGDEANGTVKVARRYLRAIERAGGLPIVCPWVDDDALVDSLLDLADGVLLTGGDDFETESLGLGPTHPKATPVPATKQGFDFALTRRALERGVPILGICYGMQLLALSAGAGFIQDLADERPGSQEHRGGAVHPVRIESATKLARLLSVEPLNVVSRHHQAIANCPADWRVSAVDEEGLIEAIEHLDRPYCVGVQWHPELSPGTRHDRLFDALVDEARSSSHSPLQHTIG